MSRVSRPALVNHARGALAYLTQLLVDVIKTILSFKSSTAGEGIYGTGMGPEENFAVENKVFKVSDGKL